MIGRQGSLKVSQCAESRAGLASAAKGARGSTLADINIKTAGPTTLKWEEIIPLLETVDRWIACQKLVKRGELFDNTIVDLLLHFLVEKKHLELKTIALLYP